MIAAIYARKSTDQSTLADDAKSVTRQVEHAQAYATRNGWTIAEAYIFIDDGISGAEFEKRPGFLRLMDALHPRPPFHVLVMSEASRLGREAIETNYALKRLLTAGVRVWCYLDDRELTLASTHDKLVLTVNSVIDDMEREKARQRTTDAMLRKARAGHVTGGRVYGYDNREVFADAAAADGHRQRLHVERTINLAEAAVVRRIFELSAAGYGTKRIAITLNQESVPAPLPRRAGRPRGWAPSTIHEMLRRELYRGEIVWNRTRKRTSWGVKRQQNRPPDDWVRRPAAHLQIVSDELWQAVQARLSASRTIYLKGAKGERGGRPVNGVDSKYLLTGMATCGCCGGSIHVRSRSHGRRRAFFYGCMTNHLRGAAICGNALMAPMVAADEAVLDVIAQDVLHPEIVTNALEKAIAALRPNPGNLDGMRAELTASLRRLDEELARLTEAIVAGGGSLPTLTAAVRDREDRKLRVSHELAALERVRDVTRLDVPRMKQDLLARLSSWRGLAMRHVSEARQMLRTLLEGRLVFTPIKDGAVRVYEFSGQAALGRLLSGIVLPKGVVAPTGFGIQTCFPPLVG